MRNTNTQPPILQLADASDDIEVYGEPDVSEEEQEEEQTTKTGKS